eukprot:TRINITY_DN5333_c0_g1_i2.p1 TRINITY_DN5333_c0_g1~~TRINITY_DN5333_c0_g1_i2.p1  ORF type:complete len:506 (+),score=41.25 TRINITY_DN5333_c0_g1_i2:31-1548(+)
MESLVGEYVIIDQTSGFGKLHKDPFFILLVGQDTYTVPSKQVKLFKGGNVACDASDLSVDDVVKVQFLDQSLEGTVVAPATDGFYIQKNNNEYCHLEPQQTCHKATIGEIFNLEGLGKRNRQSLDHLAEEPVDTKYHHNFTGYEIPPLGEFRKWDDDTPIKNTLWVNKDGHILVHDGPNGWPIWLVMFDKATEKTMISSCRKNFDSLILSKYVGVESRPPYGCCTILCGPISIAAYGPRARVEAGSLKRPADSSHSESPRPIKKTARKRQIQPQSGKNSHSVIGQNTPPKSIHQPLTVQQPIQQVPGHQFPFDSPAQLSHPYQFFQPWILHQGLPMSMCGPYVQGYPVNQPQPPPSIQGVQHYAPQQPVPALQGHDRGLTQQFSHSLPSQSIPHQQTVRPKQHELPHELSPRTFQPTLPHVPKQPAPSSAPVQVHQSGLTQQSFSHSLPSQSIPDQLTIPPQQRESSAQLIAPTLPDAPEQPVSPSLRNNQSAPSEPLEEEVGIP